jgi:hypothetical protein
MSGSSLFVSSSKSLPDDESVVEGVAVEGAAVEGVAENIPHEKDPVS